MSHNKEIQNEISLVKGAANLHSEYLTTTQMKHPAVPIQLVTSGITNTEELQAEKDQHSINGIESKVLASDGNVPPDDEGSNGHNNEKTLQGKFKSPNPLQFKNPRGIQKSFPAPPLQLKTNTIQKQEEEQEEQPIQQKSTNPNGLPNTIQTQMENALGADFSSVNIHTNSQSATDVGALAYTQGNDVHFAPGQYNPETNSGQELIGHELTHVVQQREGRVQPTTQAAGLPLNDDKGLEAEADEGGRKVVQGRFDRKSSTTFNNTSQVPKASIQMSIPDVQQIQHGRHQVTPEERTLFSHFTIYEIMAHRVAYCSSREEATEVLVNNRLINNFNIIDLVDHAPTGFKCFVIRGINANRDSPPILAFTGSEVDFTFDIRRGLESRDWGSDLRDPEPGTSQFAANRGRIERLLNGLGQRAIVTGHSLGGALAQLSAINFPDLVSNVVTFQAPGVTREHAEILTRYNERQRRSGGQTVSSVHFRRDHDIVDDAGEAHTEGNIFELSYDNSSSRDESLTDLELERAGRAHTDQILEDITANGVIVSSSDTTEENSQRRPIEELRSILRQIGGSVGRMGLNIGSAIVRWVQENEAYLGQLNRRLRIIMMELLLLDFPRTRINIQAALTLFRSASASDQTIILEHLSNTIEEGIIAEFLRNISESIGQSVVEITISGALPVIITVAGLTGAAAMLSYATFNAITEGDDEERIQQEGVGSCANYITGFINTIRGRSITSSNGSVLIGIQDGNNVIEHFMSEQSTTRQIVIQRFQSLNINQLKRELVRAILPEFTNNIIERLTSADHGLVTEHSWGFNRRIRHIRERLETSSELIRSRVRVH